MVKDIYGTGTRAISRAKYQRCLAIELQNAGLSFAREQEQTVHYKETEVGQRGQILS